MKIRIEGDSVRLRLRRSEVEQLGREGEVREQTHFPEKVFLYRLSLSPEIEVLTATCRKDEIQVLLPEEMGKSWATDQRVGFERSQPLESGRTLHILVEKDFVCLDRDIASQQDQYPNPKAPNG